MRTIGGGVRAVRAWRGIGPILSRVSHVIPHPLTLLPERALLPLRRRGFDPVLDGTVDGTRCPVRRLPGAPGSRAWLVTGYAECRQVLRDTAGFSNDFRNVPGGALFSRGRAPGGLGFADPPEHTRLRRLLTPEFTRVRVESLVPAIESIVAEQLEVLDRRGPVVDLWSDFALPVPTRTICELLGLPPEEWPEFQRWSTARFDLLGGPGASLGAVSSSLTRLTEIVRQQRRNPGPGLLGRLLREHGDDVGDQELAGLADGILTGGLESTASTLALGTLVLLGDPELMSRVRRDGSAGAEAGPDGGFVDELLRYLSVVQVAFPRFARHEVVIGGQRIRRGDAVICSLVVANRDDALGEEPGAVRPDRRAGHHLAFGHGAHRCLGAELARVELRVAFPMLLRRFPALGPAVSPEELSYRRASVVYGLDELPVRLY